jgi:hypothetical protein
MDNNQRAHEIAIAALPAIIRNYEGRLDHLDPNIKGRVDEINVFSFYQNVYNSCLKALSSCKDM